VLPGIVGVVTVVRGFVRVMERKDHAYPGTVVQFAARFPDDAACLD
jgi:hypothetical protein